MSSKLISYVYVEIVVFKDFVTYMYVFWRKINEPFCLDFGFYLLFIIVEGLGASAL